jgi:hypothetical protein
MKSNSVSLRLLLLLLLLLLQATLESSGGALALPLIKNKKTVNPRDSSTPAVFQLETAMGSGEAKMRAITLC